MNDLKLTDEQIERAAEAMHDMYFGAGSWSRISSELKHRYIPAVKAAAPYLQAPWAEPTETEVRRVLATFYKHGNLASVDALYLSDMSKALAQLFAARNAALLPKPVDPRRAKIAAALEQEYKNRSFSGCGSPTWKNYADAILAALEAK